MEENESNLLLMHDFIAFTYETFFVLFPHMRVEFIVTKEALSAEFAQRMNTPLHFFVKNGFASTA
jgi:hypothetical protein